MKQVKFYQEELYLFWLGYWDANQIEVLSLEQEFIWNNTDDIFSTKVDLMIVYDQVAMKSNQKYLS